MTTVPLPCARPTATRRTIPNAVKRVVGLVVLVALSSVPVGAQELIDRTLAIVGGRVVTLSDERTATALALVAPGDSTSVLDRLVERELMMREAERYAPPEPVASAVDARVAVIMSAMSAAALAQVFQSGGFSAARLREWIRDDLRIAAYLDQRFAVAGVPTEQDISSYYTARRDEFDRRGLAFAAALPEIRDRLAADRRRELIADWVAGLRRRADVVMLPPG